MKIIEGRGRLSASDVANFLACRRLMQLDPLLARKELEPPGIVDIWPQGSWSSGRKVHGHLAARCQATPRS